MKLFQKRPVPSAQKQVAILHITDVAIRVYISEKEKGIFRDVYIADVPTQDGVIRSGEIISAKYVSNIVQYVGRSVRFSDVHLIVPNGKIMHTQYFGKLINGDTSVLTKIAENFLREREKNPKDYIAYYSADQSGEIINISMVAGDYYNSLVAFFSDLGIRVASIQTVHQAVGYSLQEFGPTFLWDIGYAYSELALLWMGEPIITKRVNFSAEKIMQIIQQHLRVDEKEARKIFAMYGISAGHRDEALFKKLSVATREVLQGFAHFTSLWTIYPIYEQTRMPISNLFVAGPFSDTPGVMQFLTRAMRMQVHILADSELTKHHLIRNDTITKRQLLHFLPMISAMRFYQNL